MKFFSREIFLLPVFLPVSTPLRMRRNGYIMNRKYFILGYIQHIVDSYRYFYIIFLKLSFEVHPPPPPPPVITVQEKLLATEPYNLTHLFILSKTRAD